MVVGYGGLEDEEEVDDDGEQFLDYVAVLYLDAP